MAVNDYLRIPRWLYICISCDADGEQVNVFEFG
jgi:hypothetical protein